MMITFFKKIAGFSLLLLISACSSANPDVPAILDAKPFEASDYQGKWILVNYWAPWCDVCAREIPELNKFYLAHKKNVVVLGVNYDFPTHEQLRAVVKQRAISYPNLEKDPAPMLGVRDIPGVPITFLIDPDGNMRDPLMGLYSEKMLEEATGLTGAG